MKSTLPPIHPPHVSTETRDLPRVLGASHASAIVIGIIIGSGIFLVPREMMEATGSSATVYLVWIVAGLLSLFGAMTYAEVAAARPHYGGEYAFLREAYGDMMGFLYMWTNFVVSKPASIATIVTGLVRTLATFSVFSFFNTPTPLHITWGIAVAIAATWAVTLLDIIGTRRAGDVQVALTWLKIALIATIAGVCFFAAGTHGQIWHYATHYAGAKGGFTGFMIALIAALWAYDGWSDVAAVAGEVRNPQRNLPLALIGGVTAVGALYMLTNAAIQYVMPAAAVATSDRPAADALRLIVGPWGAGLVSVGMAVSIAATLVGSSLTGARVPFAAAHDRLFFKKLAYVHPRFQTPSNSLIVQAILATLLLFAIGKFKALFALAVFSEWIFYALAVSTVFVFRKRDTAADRPYSVTGYPVVPILFIAAALVLVVFSLKAEPLNTSIGSLVILAGVPVFYWFRKRTVEEDSE
ncbi:MAG: APC family permease [Acidobacteria bacterium]|nr:APC family permease [Acidobacteriota bacterium]